MTRSGASARARSMNNRSASASGSDGTGTSRSPVTINGSRLVARIATVGHARTMVSIASPAAVSTCSQLSTTMSSRLCFKADTMPLITSPSLAALRPRPAAKASSTAPAMATAASSTYQQPSGKIGAAAAAASSANLVLPAPPTPSSVTTRCPDKLGDKVGDLPLASDELVELGRDVPDPLQRCPQRREVARRRAGTVEPAAAMPFKRCSPRSVISSSATSSAVAADSRICPPWPASITRAVRFKVGP